MPNDHICLDILGPMQSYQKHKYLMLVQDVVPGITELIPMPVKSPTILGKFLTTERIWSTQQD